MAWVKSAMKWIMLISGVLTATMVYAAISPQAALQSMFGFSLDGPLAEIVVRNWGILITLVGVMLIYGAFRPQYRSLILTIAGVSKLAFIGLVLSFGSQFLSQQVGIFIIIDAIFVVLYGLYLLEVRND